MPTIETTIDEFLVDREIRGNSDKTISNYKQCLSYFVDFCGSNFDIEDIDLKQLKGYQLYLKNKDKYENHLFKPKTSGKLR